MLNNFNQDKYRLFRYAVNTLILVNQIEIIDEFSAKVSYSDTIFYFDSFPDIFESIYNRENLLKKNIINHTKMYINSLEECTNEEYFILTEGKLNYCKHMIDIPFDVKGSSISDISNYLNEQITKL